MARYAESVANSFREEEVRVLFLQMLYQLLLHGKYPFKSKKMICVGPSDSGKTTWLSPILAVVDPDHLATATNEGKFAAHMLTEDTQLMFIDEWAPGYNCKK